MTFNMSYVGSKNPYFISYRGKWVYLFYFECIQILAFLGVVKCTIETWKRKINLLWLSTYIKRVLFQFWKPLPVCIDRFYHKSFWLMVFLTFSFMFSKCEAMFPLHLLPEKLHTKLSKFALDCQNFAGQMVWFFLVFNFLLSDIV